MKVDHLQRKQACSRKQPLHRLYLKVYDYHTKIRLEGNQSFGFRA